MIAGAQIFFLCNFNELLKIFRKVYVVLRFEQIYCTLIKFFNTEVGKGNFSMKVMVNLIQGRALYRAL